MALSLWLVSSFVVLAADSWSALDLRGSSDGGRLHEAVSSVLGSASGSGRGRSGEMAEATACRPRFTKAPILRDTSKIAPRRRPASRTLPIASSPAVAAQPQLEQSGLPPNWQGITALFKSDDRQCVTREKMQCAGLEGGLR